MAIEIVARIRDKARNIVDFVYVGAPAASLSAGLSSTYYDSVSGATYELTASGWVQTAQAGASAPPSGAAGGDLGGTFPSPLVVGLYGNPVANATPVAGGFLKWASSLWQAALLALSDLPGQITTTRKLLISAGNGTTAGTPFYDVLGASDIPSIPSSRLSDLGTGSGAASLSGGVLPIAQLPASSQSVAMGGTLDGNGTALDTTWELRTVPSPCAGSIVEAFVGLSPNGTISVDVYKAARGSYGTWTKISASSPLAIAASSNEGANTALTGWTTAVAVGDVFRFVITAATTATVATFSLKLQRS